jgi:lysozyme family protein
MSDVTISIQRTLVHEGGYADNPEDPGGVTNFGITQADMPGQNMKELTQAQAVTYYMQHYVKPLYTQIQEQSVLDKLFDAGVLFGVGTAVTLLQRAVRVIPTDGIFGEDTLTAVNTFGPNLLPIYRSILTSHAIAVTQARPAETIFLKGWENRVNS